MEISYFIAPLLLLTAGFGVAFVISLSKNNNAGTGLLLVATILSFFGAAYVLDTVPDQAALCADQGGVLVETLTSGHACISSEILITELARDPGFLEVH